LIDVAALITAGWRGPWWSAPGYSRVCYPAACGTVLVPAVLIVFGMIDQLTSLGQAAAVGGIMLGLGLWLTLFAFPTNMFGMDRGVALALLAHGLVVGYFVGVVAAVVGLIGALSTAGTQRAWALAAMGLGVLAIYASRRGERYIAACCIRRYIRTLVQPGDGRDPAGRPHADA
jgi:hypothetical protein